MFSSATTATMPNTAIAVRRKREEAISTSSTTAAPTIAERESVSASPPSMPATAAPITIRAHGRRSAINASPGPSVSTRKNPSTLGCVKPVLARPVTSLVPASACCWPVVSIAMTPTMPPAIANAISSRSSWRRSSIDTSTESTSTLHALRTAKSTSPLSGAKTNPSDATPIMAANHRCAGRTLRQPPPSTSTGKNATAPVMRKRISASELSSDPTSTPKAPSGIVSMPA